MNKKGKKATSLEEYVSDVESNEEKILFENVVGQDSLNRFDKPKHKKRKKRKPKTNKQKSSRNKKSPSNA